ncbi:MAG: hypothetical protein F4047_02115, partial [Caldilineaceae bacterium SB0670_bin_27]|nr:hypothetical protein [Caldilineaceae bacterium SB0670_bin_27]
SWTEVPGAARYELHRQEAADPGWQQLDGGALRVTSFTDRGLTPGVTYQYALRAIDGNGDPLGPWSNFPKETASGSGASTPTPTSTPTVTSTLAPTSTPTVTPAQTATATATASTVTAPRLSARDAGANTIELSWTEVPGAARYELHRQEADAPGWQQLEGGTLRVTSFTDRGLTPGVTYQYAVRAIDASGEPLGPWSNFPTETASGSGAPTPAPTSTPTVMPTPTAMPTVATTERGALIALYQAAGGENWHHKNNWLSDAPLETWYGVTTEGGSGRVTELNLVANRLSGTLPNLSALSNLKALRLVGNDLSGTIPDLSALSQLKSLGLTGNRFTGPLLGRNLPVNLEELYIVDNHLDGPFPDLSALTSLVVVNLSSNNLTGSIPDLNTLHNLLILDLRDNALSGPIPDVSDLSKLRLLTLNNNRLTGPIDVVDLPLDLTFLRLKDNKLTGPLPDLDIFYTLQELELTGNRLCLPPSPSLSHLNKVITDYLKSLHLADCTEAELALVLRMPQHLTAAVDGNKITLTWNAVRDAGGYELRVWDDRIRQWRRTGGILTSTSYSHTLDSDASNYFFQVRALGADGKRSAWSERALAIVVPQRFPPPPPSLGFKLFYLKHHEIVESVHLVAPARVPDQKIAETSEIFSGMLSTRPDLLETLADFGTRIFMDDRKYPTGVQGPLWFIADVPEIESDCYIRIHEFAHTIHSAIEYRPNGHEFNSRLQAQYEASLNAGLWSGQYAATDIYEFWAEIVTFWFLGMVFDYFNPLHYSLESYDPEAAKLVEEVFGKASVPAYCR